MTNTIENSFPVISDNHDFESWCYTKYDKVRERFVWKINDFTSRTEILKSSVFSTSAKNKIEWYLQLFPTWNAKSKDSHISVYLWLQSTNETWAKPKFSIINDKNSVALSRETEYHKFTDRHLFGFPNFVERDYVLNNDNGVLPNDELTIVCEIEIRLDSETLFKEFVPVKYERPLFRMAKDIGNMLSSKSLTDLTIMVGERLFKAHKVILAARSPVFAAMFRNEMTEEKYGLLEIADINPGVFEEMLEYIYTDNEISQTKNIKELLAAADKYQLDGLKVMCEESLCKTMSVDNVLENITLAENYNCSRLKECAVSFVLNHKSDVIASSDWEGFKSSHLSLVTEMFEKMYFFK